MMRRRKQHGLINEQESTILDKPIAKHFRKLDMYPKVSDEARKSTSTGGLVSLFTTGFLLFLILVELYHYVVGTYAYRDHLSVDHGVAETVDVRFNITFPSMQCRDIHLDIMDASGVQQNAITATIQKNPVLADGEIIHTGLSSYQPPTVTTDGRTVGQYDPAMDITSEEYCGSCAFRHLRKDGSVNQEELKKEEEEAEEEDPLGGNLILSTARGNQLVFSLLSGLGINLQKKHCCNSCAEVLTAYKKVGKPKTFNKIAQCVHELYTRNPGCNLDGTLRLRKVKGNFHFAPGVALQLDDMIGPDGSGRHMHTFDTATAQRYNVSHIIHELSFGKQVSTDSTVKSRNRPNPLSERSFMVPPGKLTMMRYTIKIVPASHQVGTTESHKTFEYSSTEHIHTGDINQRGFTPGLFFIYDFWPIQITHVFQRPPFTQFLVKVSALIGGVFVVSGMLDQLLDFVTAFVKKHQTTAV